MLTGNGDTGHLEELGEHMTLEPTWFVDDPRMGEEEDNDDNDDGDEEEVVGVRGGGRGNNVLIKEEVDDAHELVAVAELTGAASSNGPLTDYDQSGSLDSTLAAALGDSISGRLNLGLGHFSGSDAEICGACSFRSSVDRQMKRSKPLSSQIQKTGYLFFFP